MTMAGPPETAAAGLSPTLLAPGQTYGGRFAVESAISEDAIGAILRAKDVKTGKPVKLRVVSPKLLGAAGVEKLRGAVRAVSVLQHKAMVAIYGTGVDPAPFVACEWIDGAPLSEVLGARRADGRGGLSLRGAFDVLSNVAAALGTAHAKGAHGALRPSVVWVSPQGRVKVGDFGVARGILEASGPKAFGGEDGAYLAPELKAGGAADVRTDVFGLGALLYAMLTCRSPSEEFIAPSRAHPDGTPQIDAVLMRCLSPDPKSRFATPDEVKQMLAPLITGEASADDFGVAVSADVDVHVDIDIAGGGSLAPKPVPPVGARPAAPRGALAPPLGGPSLPPRVGQRVAITEEFRPSQLTEITPELRSAPSLPRPPGVQMGPPPPDAVEAVPSLVPQPSAGGETDLAGLLAKITENDAPRWMVQKDKLDHGPFSGRELVQQILRGEVLEDHGLLNMDTGERRKVRAFPEFIEFLDQFKIKKAAADHQVALQRSDQVEKRTGAAKFLIAGGVFCVLALGIGAFVYTRQAAQQTAATDANLADLYERGQIEITGSAGILPEPPRRPRGGGGARAGGGGGGGGPGGLTYEDAMNQVVDIGSAAGGGGNGRQLSPGDVAGVMNRNLNGLFGCVGQELRRGANLGNVQIDLAILGSGQVQGVSVNAGSREFQGCIAGRVRQIRFPAFGAPRMGARYSFSVD